MTNRLKQARHAANAIIVVTYRDRRTTVGAVMEEVDADGFGDLAFSTIQTAVRKAARELGRLDADNETIRASK